MAHLYLFDGEQQEGLLFEVAPDPARWKRIQQAWDGFMRCLESVVSNGSKLIQRND